MLTSFQFRERDMEKVLRNLRLLHISTRNRAIVTGYLVRRNITPHISDLDKAMIAWWTLHNVARPITMLTTLALAHKASWMTRRTAVAIIRKWIVPCIDVSDLDHSEARR